MIPDALQVRRIEELPGKNALDEGLKHINMLVGTNAEKNLEAINAANIALHVSAKVLLEHADAKQKIGIMDILESANNKIREAFENDMYSLSRYDISGYKDMIAKRSAEYRNVGMEQRERVILDTFAEVNKLNSGEFVMHTVPTVQPDIDSVTAPLVAEAVDKEGKKAVEALEVFFSDTLVKAYNPAKSVPAGFRIAGINDVTRYARQSEAFREMLAKEEHGVWTGTVGWLASGGPAEIAEDGGMYSRNQEDYDKLPASNRIWKFRGEGRVRISMVTSGPEAGLILSASESVSKAKVAYVRVEEDVSSNAAAADTNGTSSRLRAAHRRS